MGESTAEEWRPVPGFNGWYDVSSHGRVRSWLMRGMWRYILLDQPELMHQSTHVLGYKTVTFRFGNRQNKNMRVHQLVAWAFLGPQQDGIVVRHLNDRKTDNRLENLAYGTAADNIADLIRNGKKPGPKVHAVCARGHEMTADNIHISGLNRVQGPLRLCKKCTVARQERAKYRRMERKQQTARARSE